MALTLDDLPDDVSSLKALLIAARAETEASRAENARLEARNERLDHIISVLRRARFGRSSERIDDDQMALALEDVETAFAVEDAGAETHSGAIKAESTKRRRANRGHLPAHLLREEVVVEPETNVNRHPILTPDRRPILTPLFVVFVADRGRSFGARAQKRRARPATGAIRSGS